MDRGVPNQGKGHGQEDGLRQEDQGSSLELFLGPEPDDYIATGTRDGADGGSDQSVEVSHMQEERPRKKDAKSTTRSEISETTTESFTKVNPE